MNNFFSVLDLPQDKKYGLTIGNFDGVHKGHQFVLKTVVDKCREKGWLPIVLTFNPHPMAVLLGKKNFLISDYREKRERLHSNKIENILELNFNRELSQLSPKDFLNDYIFKSHSIKGIFLGHDFSFGANKSGNHDFVMNFCKDLQVEVETLPRFTGKAKVYSSTKVREALLAGDAEEATKILGRPFEINGVVEKGEGRGKSLGFATANIRVAGEKLLPVNGVYFSTTIIDGKELASITNIGSNPTFNGVNEKKIIETHILNYQKDIYGTHIKTFFHKKLRNEMKFSSALELVRQVKSDVQARESYAT